MSNKYKWFIGTYFLFFVSGLTYGSTSIIGPASTSPTSLSGPWFKADLPSDGHTKNNTCYGKFLVSTYLAPYVYSYKGDMIPQEYMSTDYNKNHAFFRVNVKNIDSYGCSKNGCQVTFKKALICTANKKGQPWTASLIRNKYRLEISHNDIKAIQEWVSCEKNVTNTGCQFNQTFNNQMTFRCVNPMNDKFRSNMWESRHKLQFRHPMSLHRVSSTEALSGLAKEKGEILFNDHKQQKLEQIEATKEREKHKLFTKRLHIGEQTQCGLVINTRGSVAEVQTASTVRWFKKDSLYPKGSDNTCASQ